jgi:hypothetical protein
VRTGGTIANRAYAPKPGAPARPTIVREACQQLAAGETVLEKRYLHEIPNTTAFGEPKNSPHCVVNKGRCIDLAEKPPEEWRR